MATKQETKITQDLIAEIKHKNGDALHIHGSALQRGGEPDICGEIRIDGVWRHLKIEVKTPEGEPSQRQLYRLQKYHERGYVAGIVTNITEMYALFNAYDYYWFGNDYFLKQLPYAKDIYDAT